MNPTTTTELRQLLGNDVVLLGWPLRSKGTPKKWGHLKAEDMTPAYLKKIEGGNIGVALGPVSGGLVALDVDDERLVEPFLDLNPFLKGALQTHGARGCVFWLRMKGEYPAVTVKLKTVAGEDVGEWRAGKNTQSIIYGIHPNGNPYQILNKAKPLVVDFASIAWPNGIANPPKPIEPMTLNLTNGANVTQLHSRTVTQLHSYSASHAVGVCASFSTIEQIVDYSLPTREHSNHNLLWNLARGAKSLETQSGKLSPEKRTEIFNRWYEQAHPFLRAEQTRDHYLIEFMQAYANARLPLGESGVTEAWKRAKENPFPAEAISAFTDPKFQLIVAFLRELQINAGAKPFFLSCRTLSKLLGKDTPMTCSRILKGLAAYGFIEEVAKGTVGPKGDASSYRYLKTL